MAYAWAGPINVCVQEAAQVSAKLFPSLGHRGPSKNHRAFTTSTTTAAHSGAGYGQTVTSRAESWASSLWQLSAQLKRSLTPTSSLTALAGGSSVLTKDPVNVTSNSATQGASQPVGTTSESSRGQGNQPKPLLNDFLATSDAVEVDYAALLADLADKAYDINILSASELFETHGLQLVSTSRSIKQGPANKDVQHKQQPKPVAQLQAEAPDSSPSASTQISPRRNRDDQPRLAAAVAHALVSKAPILHHEGGTLTPSLSVLSLSSSDDSSSPRSNRGSGDELAQQDHHLQLPLVTLVPGSPCNAEAAAHADWDQNRRSHHQLSAEGLPEQMLAASAQQNQTLDAPAEWFACDDPVTKIRYLAIQGSTSLEHWQINLQFEPVIFEDPALGVRIHRGVYMAALQLYDDLVPLVRQHLATSPFASVTLTGHSLGGSLASVLMLLMVLRGVLPPDSVSPAYTFGAPAVFCGGAGALSAPSRCHSCGLDCPEAHAAQAMGKEETSKQQATKDAARCSRKPKGLFAQLGLGEEHIVNVIMHRDIVPRAFVCDYMAVADLLVSWVPSFRHLHNLHAGAQDDGHKSLYSFLGRVAVIQPDPSSPFVHSGDATHPHLPNAPGLYRLVAPAPPIRVHSLRGSFDLPTHNAALHSAFASVHAGDHGMGKASDRPRPYTPAPIRLATLEEDDADQGEEGEGDAQKGWRRRQRRASAGPRTSGPATGASRAPRTLKQAVLNFMNTPHPLTTLSEYAAYGANGSISRYHNPRNYTLGLLALVGKAPHQQQNRLVAASRSPPLPSCPLPQAPSSSGPAYFDPLSLSPDPWTIPDSAMSHATPPDVLCTMLQDTAMSPEARRLIRQPAGQAAPRGTGAGGGGRAPRVDSRRGGAPGTMGVTQAAGAGPRLSGISGLVQVPGLSALLSAVGYWGGRSSQ